MYIPHNTALLQLAAIRQTGRLLYLPEPRKSLHPMILAMHLKEAVISLHHLKGANSTGTIRQVPSAEVQLLLPYSMSMSLEARCPAMHRSRLWRHRVPVRETRETRETASASETIPSGTSNDLETCPADLASPLVRLEDVRTAFPAISLILPRSVLIRVIGKETIWKVTVTRLVRDHSARTILVHRRHERMIARHILRKIHAVNFPRVFSQTTEATMVDLAKARIRSMGRTRERKCL